MASLAAFAGLFKRDDFGMVAAVVIVEAFADHFAVLNEDRADEGIRMREGGSASRSSVRAQKIHFSSLVAIVLYFNHFR